MATALEVVRIILEYFGWEGYEIEELFYGGRGSRDRRRSIVRRIGRELARYQFSLFTKRSIVREIGSRLPLKPCRRPYFELSLTRTELESAEEFEGKPLSQVLMASLADVGWITRDEDSSSDVILDDEEELIEHTSPELETEQLATFNHPAEDKKENSSHSDEAMLKISALEEELQKLRAQIAMMVVSAPQNQVATPSTPVGPVAPPPPPPPPPPTPLSTPRKPVSQIIKENRAKRLSLAPGVCMNSVEPSGGCSLPNMADVLKGLGTVKLRSVERSPGGTPLRKAPIPTDGSDPASIIAQALKKKFAHRRCHEVNSPDANKENSSPGSPFGTSPSSPIKPVPFGPHMLKPTNKKRRSSTGLQKTTKPRTSLVEVC